MFLPIILPQIGRIGKSSKLKSDNLLRRSAAMDWQEHITLDPAILVGKPVIKGTRLAVEFVIDLLAQGWAEAEILRNYPGSPLSRSGLAWAMQAPCCNQKEFIRYPLNLCDS